MFTFQSVQPLVLFVLLKDLGGQPKYVDILGVDSWYWRDENYTEILMKSGDVVSVSNTVEDVAAIFSKELNYPTQGVK